MFSYSSRPSGRSSSAASSARAVSPSTKRPLSHEPSSSRRSTAGLRSKKDTIVGFRCQRDPNPLRRTLKLNQNPTQHGMYPYLFSTANRGSAPPPLSKPHSKPLRRTRKFNQNRIPRRTLKFEKPRSCLLQACLAMNEGDSGLQLYVNFELFWISNSGLPKNVHHCT